MSFRIGHGYDIHRIVPNRPLVLGGVRFATDYGLDGHSDADCLTHAICDALLGAAAMGDIGRHFPDTDQSFKGVDSRILLRSIADKLNDQGFSVVNVDVTIVAQKPKLAPYIDRMRATIALDLKVEIDAVNVKATTTEGMGFEGRGEGISASAVALLDRRG